MTDSGTADVTELANEPGGPGDIEGSNGRGLPYDVEEHILSKLPLWEVAHMSATSRSFQETFTRRLDTERKARSDLAQEQFGRERIVAIAALIQRCVNGEAMDPAFGGETQICCWMSADGKLHVVESAMWGQAQRAIRTRGDVLVTIHDFRQEGATTPCVITISWGRNDSRVQVWIWRSKNTITIVPSSDEDLQGAALVQVLLSGDHGPIFRNGGCPAEIHIQWCVFRDTDGKKGADRKLGQVSEAGLRTQIAPLMPRGPAQVSFRSGFATLSLWK